MEISVALKDFALQHNLSYSGCCKYIRTNGDNILSVSYGLSEDSYAKIELVKLRPQLQKIVVEDAVFVDVVRGIIVEKVSDDKPIKNMYRIQITYKSTNPKHFI